MDSFFHLPIKEYPAAPTATTAWYAECLEYRAHGSRFQAESFASGVKVMIHESRQIADEA
jgi:hypothetical protein